MNLSGFSTNTRETDGLFEIFAGSSVAAGFYDSYRFMGLLSLRPDLRDEITGRSETNFPLPALDSDTKVCKALTGRLRMTLRFAAGDLYLPMDCLSSPENARVLARYCVFIEQASMTLSRDLFQWGPDLERVRNPLTDEFIAKLFSSMTHLPKLDEFIN